MKFLYIFLFSSAVQFSFSQYWQQQVNFTIDVKLDDIKHELNAFETIEYINNSPNELKFIYMHLWPNAYQKKRTALFRQLEKNKNKIYYKLKADEFGLIDSLDFRANNEKLKWEFCQKDSIDVAKIYFSSPLKSGDKITITTPFHVKIPSSRVSRLGHTDQQYQITQWFPKPAVYDKDGWQQMPYLNQGEFYSEFGTFDVKISLPKNYVVGATGDLVNGEAEINWMNERAVLSKDESFRNNVANANYSDTSKFKLQSDKEFKTLHFHQDQVHDFAWFASKNYLIAKDEAELPYSKNKVMTWAMFSPKYYKTWKYAAKYVSRAVSSYSKWNGDYLYKHATAVEGALSAGAGMEYPNITVLPGDGDSIMLDLVTAHEVGHNWFYGMLGTNERKYAWMDEGINTSNEIRYMNDYYENTNLLVSFGVPSELSVKFGLKNADDKKVQQLEYILQTRINKAQACNINARNYSSTNYGAIVYAKAGLSFYYLRQYLGDELYDKCMQAYFNQWKIKHPQPEDLKNVAESVSGKNLDWLFKDLLGTKEVLDYKIISANQKESSIDIVLKNKSSISAPVNIGLMKKDSLIANKWFDGFQSKNTLSFNTTIKDYDHIVIDPNEDMLQPYRRNDHLKSKGVFKKLEPLQINFLAKFEDDKHTPINIAPVLGYNDHNKWMLGMWIHNLEITKHFEYQLMPMYAFGSKTLTGQGSFFYNTLKGERWSNMKVGIVAKSYRDFEETYKVINELQQYNTFNYTQRRDYLKLAPEVTFSMRNRNYNKAATSYFKFRSVNILKSFEGPKKMFNSLVENINIFNYNYTKKLLLYQEWVDPQLELSPDFGKLSASYKIHIVYNRKKTRGFSARAFGGVMLYDNAFFIERVDNTGKVQLGKTREPFEPFNNSKQYSLSGQNDYLYDNTFIVRNPTGNGFFQQNWMMEKDGAMRNINLNDIDRYDAIFSLNLKLDVPKLPIFFYHDFAVVRNNSYKISKGVNNFGIALFLIPNIAEIYFPIYNDGFNVYQKGNYTKAIRFQLNLDLMNPVKILKDNL
jgi:Peptidase family M1 domain